MQSRSRIDGTEVGKHCFFLSVVKRLASICSAIHMRNAWWFCWLFMLTGTGAANLNRSFLNVVWIYGLVILAFVDSRKIPHLEAVEIDRYHFLRLVKIPSRPSLPNLPRSLQLLSGCLLFSSFGRAVGTNKRTIDILLVDSQTTANKDCLQFENIDLIHRHPSLDCRNCIASWHRRKWSRWSSFIIVLQISS